MYKTIASVRNRPILSQDVRKGVMNMGELVYDDTFVKIYKGNCLDILAELPAESIQVVVTSPPY